MELGLIIAKCVGLESLLAPSFILNPPHIPVPCVVHGFKREAPAKELWFSGMFFTLCWPEMSRVGCEWSLFSLYRCNPGCMQGETLCNCLATFASSLVSSASLSLSSSVRFHCNADLSVLFLLCMVNGVNFVNDNFICLLELCVLQVIHNKITPTLRLKHRERNRNICFGWSDHKGL